MFALISFKIYTKSLYTKFSYGGRYLTVTEISMKLSHYYRNDFAFFVAAYFTIWTTTKDQLNNYTFN